MNKTIIGLALSFMLVTPAFASTFTPSAVCSNTPETVLNWHADNASTTDQAFSWDRASGTEIGSDVVPASAGIDFSTGSSGTTTPDSLTFTFDDGTGAASVVVPANVTPCVPAPIVVPTPTPVPVVEARTPIAFAIGGRATNAEMQASLSPADYQVYLAHKAGATVSNDDPRVIAILEQILALLQQEVAMFTK